MNEHEFIKRLLPEVGAYLLEQLQHRSEMTPRTKKGPADLVTEADIAAQQRIEQAIAEAFPEDVLVGEESGLDRPPEDPSARCWVCDPIDGTHNFARGMIPAWGVSLAFVEGGQVRAGGVCMPGLGEFFLAQLGGGATRNGRPTRVTTVDRLDESRIEIDFIRPDERPRSLAAGAAAMREAGQIRCHGAAVVGLCTVASGGAEAYCHGGLSPWDFAAAMLIIREAGGRVTRLDGRDVAVFDGQRGLIASNGRVHDQLLRGVL